MATLQKAHVFGNFLFVEECNKWENAISCKNLFHVLSLFSTGG